MARGSRVDVCVRSPGQVRKEAAQVDSDGSPGSFPSIAKLTHEARLHNGVGHEP